MDISFLNIISVFNKGFTTWVVFPFLVLVGSYLSWKLRFVQFTKLKLAFTSLFAKSDGEGSLSRYQSVASVLASGFGTGNISGMAVALATGGPGALFWMWVMAALGSIVQVANTVVGLKYREKNKNGEYVGGPMYYLRDGLKWKKLAAFFAVLVILVAFTAGNLVQVNSIALPLSHIGISPWISGIIMAVVVGAAVLGGAMRIASVAAILVPLMGIFYICGAATVIGMYYDHIVPALLLVMKSAFGFGPAVGGLLGFGVMQAIIYGFNRAIFATDAGTGVAPLLQSGACSKQPVMEGVATLIAPFIVMIVCTLTFFALLVTGAFQVSGLESTNMVIYAFKEALGTAGASVVFIALCLFGYSSIIGMAACLDRAVEYLFGQRWLKHFRWLFILVVPVGALLQSSLAWILADIAMTMMLVINLAATAGLTKEVIDEHNAFFPRKARSRPLTLAPKTKSLTKALTKLPEEE